MTNEELSDLEKRTLNKLHALMSSEVLPVRKEHVEACICVLVFCRESGTHGDNSLWVAQDPSQWKLAPKMRLRCINDRYVGISKIGEVGILLPSSVDEDGDILWAVSFGLNDGNGTMVRVWDSCPEDIIRADFQPVLENE